jgi:ABC-2 type transport system permease protein
MTYETAPQTRQGSRANGITRFVESVGSFTWLEWKTLRYYPSNLLLSLTEGLVNTGIWLFIGLFLQSVAGARVAEYGGSYVSYVVIGVAFFEVAQTALLSPFKSVSEAFWDKRLEAYNLAPDGIWAHILGRLSWQLAYALLIEAAVLGAIVATVGIDFSPAASPLLALLCLAIFGVACLGLGLAGASTFFLLEVKEGSEPVSWTATLLARVASGVYYPLSIIPGWLQPLGLLVPHTYALRAIRLILLDGRTLNDAQVGLDLAVLGIYAVAALAGGGFLLHAGLRHAERTSGLSVVG